MQLKRQHNHVEGDGKKDEYSQSLTVEVFEEAGLPDSTLSHVTV